MMTALIADKGHWDIPQQLKDPCSLCDSVSGICHQSMTRREKLWLQGLQASTNCELYFTVPSWHEAMTFFNLIIVITKMGP